MKLYKYFAFIFVLVFFFGFVFYATSEQVGPYFTVTTNPTSVNVNSSSMITVSMTNTDPDGCLHASANCYCFVKDSNPLISWTFPHQLPLTHTFPSYVLTDTSPITETIDCKWTPTTNHIEENSVDIYINPPSVTMGVSPTGGQGSSASNPLPLPNSGATVVFSAINADACMMNGQTLGVTHSFSTGPLSSNTTYSVDCYGPGVSSTGQTTVYVGSMRPDLTAGAVSPVSAIVNLPATFSSTISNIGNAGTGSNFNNFFQVASSSGGGGTITDLPSVSSPALAVGGTSSISTTYAFTSTGTRSIRACADKSNSGNNGTINETNENNNCGAWVDVTVNPQTPVPGVCSAYHYNCISGNSTNHGQSATKWTWRCEGI